MDHNILETSGNIDNIDNLEDINTRATVFTNAKVEMYSKTYKSKWANFKLFLKERKSLESSVKFQKKNTVEQFSSKCQVIYEKKILIHLINKKNQQMFKHFNSTGDYTIDKDTRNIAQKIAKLKIYDASKSLESISNYIKEFLFAFRTNNDLMLRLIECVNNDEYEVLVPFLCHFFYENFYMESTEQEEMLYIIYLLLEKEIDSLFTPSVSTFLEQSFISNFLTEMGNRYEIKHYINIILNDLIMQIEETNISYNSMDILSNLSKNNEGVFYDMSEEDSKNYFNRYENMSKGRNDSINNFKKFGMDDKLTFAGNDQNIQRSVFLTNESTFAFKGTTISISDIKNSSNYSSNIPLKKEINKDLFNNIDEKFLRHQLMYEKDEIMKHFYIRQLRKLQSAKNSDLFNGNKYYEKLKKEKKIFKTSVVEFNTGYYLITNFIDKLLTKLENNTIIPYQIRVICGLINTLLNKRFKNITKIQCNILICQYLFDKLIFPVLQNPDINDAGKDLIISFNTRKTLSNIYDVCKKLVRGELFSITDMDYFVIFNKFIINNFPRINDIIEKIIKVKPPQKLIKLSEKFYAGEEFFLDSLKRSNEEINYDYFEENSNDFMQHKSICFSIKDLSLLYHIVERNKERFEELSECFPKLSSIKILENDKSIQNNYYMIISDEYKNEVNDLLNHEENKITLSRAKDIDSLLTNIKNCIDFVINNVDISPNWKWVKDNWDTFKTFQFIHTYLTTFNLDSKNYLKNQEGKIPLSWYSLYILNNLKKLKGTAYFINDYKKLYDIMKSETASQLKKMRKLNNFLTVNMSTKFILIDHKIKMFNQELENVKKTELSIKTVQFIENTKIKVCLTTVNELYNISKYISGFYDHFDVDSNDKFVLFIREKKAEKKNDCIHKSKIDNRIYQREKLILKKNHCKNINQFCLHFAGYYKYILQDIIREEKQTPTPSSNNQKLRYKQSSAKEVVEIYMKNLTNVIKESEIFNIDTGDKKRLEEDKKDALHIIWNYILKNICIKICQDEMNEKDKNFRKICKKLGWIKPENLGVVKGVFNSSLLEKAEYHIKKMDDLRTPGGMLDEFGIGVQLINSMFIFMLNQRQAEAGELLPLIIYGIINCKPKRMIFNINFIKYFMGKNQELGNVGYNLTQAESSTYYIQNLNHKQLQMDEQEFNKRCDECMNSKRIKQNKSINDDSDYD